jgi:hypothetical protein
MGMPEILSAGYYLQYLWEKRQRLDALAGFDLERTRRTLASFHLDLVQSSTAIPKAPMTDVEHHIVAVYTNLLQRGLPTLAPLRVERTLAASVPKSISLEEQCTGGAYHFEHG